MKYPFIFFFVLSVSGSSFCFSQNSNTAISSSAITVQLPNSNTAITTNNTEELIQNQPRKLSELPVPIKQTNNKETTIKQEEYLENRETPVNTITPKN
ncbi:MAG: hypothetical protein HND27_02540 [Bacteroidetes bacterium]|nr:hypothetical protein [Bacteroidota bacterium]MBV6460873.1 hypothetical protein [Flavobacteriales bacterium]WKZ75728.1 MAG: hypothetical protein QY303_02305 [Vicingaceae bacterium]MCL4815295.1 hypothetical protein [Flavobacteriales bacterium]NOG94637.1 hypothetical protein [Bacteroidota bacterium]